MSFYRSVVKPLLFNLDAETAHNLGLWAVTSGCVSASPTPDEPCTFFGVQFKNPVGLAAGFDKNGIGLDHWHKLGFGFVEVGTVTRHPQPGNPKPRLFRLPNDRAIINRMGFNNEGADALARRLETSNCKVPIGINIGKSKVTPLEDSAQDYAYSYRLLAPFADYVVVNVSSPNTPGLRALQERSELTKILETLKQVDATKPLFVKVAPDLNEAGLADVVAVVQETSLTGIVATNTTLSRDGLIEVSAESGGLSGAPLLARSNDVLAYFRKNCSPETVLIGVGGIMAAEDAKSKIESGANLIQVYSGWVYGGPNFVSSLLPLSG